MYIKIAQPKNQRKAEVTSTNITAVLEIRFFKPYQSNNQCVLCLRITLLNLESSFKEFFERDQLFFMHGNVTVEYF